MKRIDLNRPCAANYYGAWMIEPRAANALVAMAAQGAIRQQAGHGDGEAEVYGSVAVVRLHGLLMKGGTMADTSTVEVRRMLRHLDDDPSIGGIMMHVDSPGGTAAGTPQLADDIMAIRRRGRTVIHAHGEDMVASAAYFAASQADVLTLNKEGEAGSIGTIAVVEDMSQNYAEQGVKVHVVATGPRKGDFVEGTEVTDEQLADLRSSVERLNAGFLSAVRRGRAMSDDDLKYVSTGPDGGNMYDAERAVSLGLVDAIASEDEAMRMLFAAVETRMADRRAESDSRRRRMKLAGG